MSHPSIFNHKFSVVKATSPWALANQQISLNSACELYEISKLFIITWNIDKTLIVSMVLVLYHFSNTESDMYLILKSDTFLRHLTA